MARTFKSEEERHLAKLETYRRYNNSEKGIRKRRELQRKEKHRQKSREYKERNREHLMKKEAERLERLGVETGVQSYKRALYNWGKIVKQRDNNKCVKCNSTEKLHAHHIKPRKLHPNLTFDVNNGETLCKECHWNIHYGNI